jgi:excisionase family DNA binding protein
LDAATLDSSGPEGRALAYLAIAPIPPRLLDVHGLAAYLSVPEATVYDLAARNVLRRVRVPLPDGGELRKLLFDRAEVDRAIEGWKE